MRIPTADGKTITKITVSIGATTLIPKPDDTSKAFLTKADENLYTAKETGRNRVVHS
jgi:diguanylate cyclase (GGDEF)-like protein